MTGHTAGLKPPSALRRDAWPLPHLKGHQRALAYAVATTSRTPTDDDKLDEALEETFPASDAPANTVATGVHLDVESAPSSDIDVQDRREANRFETVVGGQVAYLSYERRPDAIVFLHTEVPESLRGRGIAARLAKAAITSARAEGLRLVAVCPYVRTYLRRHSG